MVVKVLWDEEDSELAREFLARNSRRLAGPELLRYEVANVIRYTEALRGQDRALILEAFQAMPIRLLPVDAVLMAEALQLSLARNVTVCDASYAVLANHLGSSLVTADERFVRRLRDPRVVPLSGDPPEDAG